MSAVASPAVGRDAVDAQLHLVAEAVDGRTRLVTMRSAFPVALRRTGPDRVHLVGTGAWPLGGDRVRMDIEVGAGASVEVASVAANVALPGRHGQPSTADVRVRVATGGRLRLDLGPTIVARGAEHLGSLDVRLESGASMALRELVILGREHENGGRSRQRLDLTVDDEPVVREHALRPHPQAAAFTDRGARAVGSVIVVDDRGAGDGCGPVPRALGTGARGSVFALPNQRGWRAVALGDDVAAVDHWLTARWVGGATQPS
jgi:urease accessory protein